MKTQQRPDRKPTTPASTRARPRVTLKTLVGSGDKIALLTLPVVVVGVALNLAYPAIFSVGGPAPGLRLLAAALLIPGVIIWAWSVVLILRKVPRGELITTGPYALVKHPLYTGVALLVAPALGVLLNSWLGAVVGAVMYAGSRLLSGDEEALLASTFGDKWEAYCSRVKIPWL